MGESAPRECRWMGGRSATSFPTSWVRARDQIAKAYKTVNSTCKTVKALLRQSRPAYKTVKATCKTVKALFARAELRRAGAPRHHRRRHGCTPVGLDCLTCGLDCLTCGIDCPTIWS